MHETLDETIDRVAGEMSAVADDPGLTARVRERMNGRRRVWLMPTLAAASVAGIVVIAAALWPRAEPIPAPPRTSHELAANVAAPTVERVTSPALEGGTLVPSQPAMVDADVEPVEPAPLAIAELTIAPLAMPDVAEIAPLQVENLEIAGMEFEPLKESR